MCASDYITLWVARWTLLEMSQGDGEAEPRESWGLRTCLGASCDGARMSTFTQSSEREPPKHTRQLASQVSIIRTYQCILVRVWMSQIHVEKYLKLSDHALAFHPNQSEQTRAMKTQLSSHCYLSWFCDPAWSPHRSLRTLQVWDEDRELVAFGGNSDMLLVMHHILKLFVFS